MLAMASGFFLSLRIPSLKKVALWLITSCWCFSSSVAGSNFSRLICTLSGDFLGILLTSYSAIWIPPPSIVLDPGIHDFIQQVAHQVCCHHQDRKKDRGGHDQRIVPVVDGADELAAQSADGEDRLHHHGARDDIGDLGAGIGDDRDQRVAQRMLEDDLPAVDALGARRADVVLVERVEHAGLRQTRRVGHRVGRQRDDRQNVAVGGRAPDRHPAQLNAEHQQQQRGENEAGHRREQRWEKDNQAVGQAIAGQRREAAKNGAAGQRHGHSQQAQFGRNRERLLNNGADLTAVFQRDAEIALEQLPHIDEKLLRQGLVEGVAGIQGGNGRRAERLFAVERAAGDRVHQ